jgi:hypothetical protein
MIAPNDYSFPKQADLTNANQPEKMGLLGYRGGGPGFQQACNVIINSLAFIAAAQIYRALWW